MGSEISGCCGGSLKEPQLEIATHNNKQPLPHDRGTTLASPNDTQQKEEFLRKITNGIDAEVILQDKSKLKCLMNFNEERNALVLSCDNKTRNIPLSDVKSVLHTPEQLKRVETAAGILENDPCAAIHLAQSGNCIPLFFSSMEIKNAFVQLVADRKRLLADGP